MFNIWRHCLPKIAFLVRTLLLWQVETWFWCLYPCFKLLGIELIHFQYSRTITFYYIWKPGQFMFNIWHHRLPKIKFLVRTQLLWLVETWFWCLYPCFNVPGIELIHLQYSRTYTFYYIWKPGQVMFNIWRHCLPKIPFFVKILLLWQVQTWFWCLYPCFKVPGIELNHFQYMIHKNMILVPLPMT